MKHSKITIILTILFSILLFVLGLFTFGPFFEFFLPKVENGFYQDTEVGGPFRTSLIFSLVLGLTPILLLLTWRLSPIISTSKKLSSILIAAICIILAIVVRQQMLKSYFTGLTKNISSTGDKINVSYPIDEVNFEYYLLAGLFIDCVVSYLLFRQKKP